MTGKNKRAKPSLDDTEDATSSLSSQSLLEQQSPLVGDLRDNQASHGTSSALRSLKHSKNGGKSSSARSSANVTGSKAQSNPSAKSSVVSGAQVKIPKPKLDIRALFDYYKRNKHKSYMKRRRRNEETHKCKPREKYIKRKRLKIPKREQEREQKKRYRREGFKFSFLKKNYGVQFTSRMRFLFEHAALKGFLEYIKLLKCEHHIKKALAGLNAEKELEKESLVMRKHKYLDDDDESLSPIEETNEEDKNENVGEEEGIGARIVENSCFILSSQIPGKKSKRKTK